MTNILFSLFHRVNQVSSYLHDYTNKLEMADSPTRSNVGSPDASIVSGKKSSKFNNYDYLS
jgi:hypothetical protein